MSRVGKKPIIIPEKTEVKFDGRTMVVKGPAGEITRVFRPDIAIEVKDGQVIVGAKRPESYPMWGTYASHIRNMIKGVHTPYTKKLIIEGIGFKSDIKGTELIMSLGFSHQVKMQIPAGLKVTADKNLITVVGVDKEQVGRFTAEVRSKKKPEPYKGKGIRYETEVIRRKQGKKTA